jgi:hypothetical protein
MLNFRQFPAGPDPMGRTYDVVLKWMQTAISIRHSDTVDVRFILQGQDGREEKTIALPHADLVKLSKGTGHEMTDAWCSRLAAMHLEHLVATGEDEEKDLVTVTSPQLEGYAAALAEEEKAAIGRGSV